MIRPELVFPLILLGCAVLAGCLICVASIVITIQDAIWLWRHRERRRRA